MRRNANGAPLGLRRDDLEHVGDAGSRPAEHEQRAIGRTHEGDRLPLTLGLVRQAEEHATRWRSVPARRGACGELVDRHQRGQRGQPRTRGGAMPGPEGRGRDVPAVRQGDPHLLGRGVAGAPHERGSPPGRAAGQSSGVVGAQQRPAVGGIRHAQADPQGAVREQIVADHTRRPLRAEDEMDAERAAARRDVGEEPVQFGMVREQRGELVDHHHQPREPHPRIQDVAGPCRGDGGLAAAQLGPQAVDRTSRSRTVEIRDDAGDVRHAGEAVEGGAALEIREQEGHLVGGARRAQREDPGDEQLALARAGDARDHGVRPVRDEIDDGRPPAGDADRRGKAPRRLGNAVEKRREREGLAAVADEAEAALRPALRAQRRCLRPAPGRRPRPATAPPRRRAPSARHQVRRRSGPPGTAAAAVRPGGTVR